MPELIVTHVVLFGAIAVAEAFIVRIRCCSYDYKRINTRPVMIVLAMYLLSYAVRMAFFILY
jgi:hypothetical protein